MNKHLDAALDLMDHAVRQAAVERLSIALTNVKHHADDLDHEEHSPARRADILRQMQAELHVATQTVDGIRLAEGLGQ